MSSKFKLDFNDNSNYVSFKFNKVCCFVFKNYLYNLPLFMNARIFAICL